jgi:hypothetical protein
MMLAPKMSGVGMDCVVQLLAAEDKAMIGSRYTQREQARIRQMMFSHSLMHFAHGINA